MAISYLMNTEKMDALEHLALIISIRFTIAQFSEPPLNRIFNETMILGIFKQTVVSYLKYKN